MHAPRNRKTASICNTTITVSLGILVVEFFREKSIGNFILGAYGIISKFVVESHNLRNFLNDLQVHFLLTIEARWLAGPFHNI